MFDPGIIHVIEDSNIDRPSNAISLTKQWHQHFGDFMVAFESVLGSIDTAPAHTYTMDAVAPIGAFIRPRGVPVTRTLHLSPNRTIDPPSARLFAVHRAIAKILYLSAAGSYVDEIQRDMEEIDLRNDGSVDLGRIVPLKVGR